MLIIGFGNKARQGKDTAAEAIQEHYARENELKRRAGILRGVGTQVRILKFADALYEEVNDAIKKGIWEHRLAENTYIALPDWAQPESNPEISERAPYGKHPKLLQWWGTEYRRNNFGENYWVDKTFASIPKNADIILITDVRFPNEADAVKQHGGYTINVQRLREDGQPYFASDRLADHISETALDGYNWDYYIKSKSAIATAEVAVTYAELLRGLHEQAKAKL